jgi:hypothetical protein
MCVAFSSDSFIATVLYIRNKKKNSLICYLKYYIVFHRATGGSVLEHLSSSTISAYFLRD